MARTWKSLAAGVIGVIIGLPLTVGLAWHVLSRALFYVGPPEATGPWPLVLASGLFLTFAGVLCLVRRWWWLALVASVLGIPAGLFALLFFAGWLSPNTPAIIILFLPEVGAVLAIFASVLVGLSRTEFRRATNP